MASTGPPGPVVITAWSLLPNDSIFRRHWNPFHSERSLLLEAICTMRLATLQYGQSYQVSIYSGDTGIRELAIHGLKPVFGKC